MFRKLGTFKAVTIFGILYAISQSLLVVILKPLGLGTFLRLQISFSKDFTIQAFELWKADGVFSLYRLHLYPDLLHPVWYGLFLISSMVYLLEGDKAAEKFRWMLALPVISAMGDCLENMIQFVFLSRPDDSAVTDPLVFITSLASSIKWSLASLSLLAVLALAVRRFAPSAK